MRKLLGLLLALLALAFVSAQQDNPDATLWDGLVADENFTILVSLLEQAGLAEALQGSGPLTLFAPTNDAFEDFEEDELQRISGDPLSLEALLTTHVLEGAYGINELQDAGEGELVSMQGEPLVVATTAGGLSVNEVGLVATNVDNTYSNGVLHVIESVLVPASVRDGLEMAAEEETAETTSAEVAAVAEPVALAEPLGVVEVGVSEPYDVAPDLGAIVLSATTPDDQHPNYDVVGPDGYYEHFDIDDDPGEERVLNDLLPGVYSIASSDEGLELSATLVEVRAGEVVPVHFNLEPLEQFGYGMGDYAAYGYPAAAGPWGLGYTPYDNAEFGSVMIASEEFADAEYVVTGPNGYSETFAGSTTLENLVPGTYVVAATGEGYQLARSVFDVQVSQRTELVPVLVTVETASVSVEGDTEGDAATPAFADFDADADGFISEEEFAGLHDDAGLFGQFDADGDALISEEEFTANEGLFQ